MRRRIILRHIVLGLGFISILHLGMRKAHADNGIVSTGCEEFVADGLWTMQPRSLNPIVRFAQMGCASATLSNGNVTPASSYNIPLSFDGKTAVPLPEKSLDEWLPGGFSLEGGSVVTSIGRDAQGAFLKGKLTARLRVQEHSGRFYRAEISADFVFSTHKVFSYNVLSYNEASCPAPAPERRMEVWIGDLRLLKLIGSSDPKAFKKAFHEAARAPSGVSEFDNFSLSLTLKEAPSINGQSASTPTPTPTIPAEILNEKYPCLYDEGGYKCTARGTSGVLVTDAYGNKRCYCRVNPTYVFTGTCPNGQYWNGIDCVPNGAPLGTYPWILDNKTYLLYPYPTPGDQKCPYLSFDGRLFCIFD